MFNTPMFKAFRTATALLIALTIVTGGLYPLLVTVIAQTLMHDQATGSLREHDGRVVGSALIGQTFDQPRYFWGRPSATSAMPYDGGASSGSNLGPTNPALRTAVEERVEALRAANPGQLGAIPLDLVTTSASGLDPHISPAAAFWQVARVARARQLSERRVADLVEDHTEGRTLGILGEPRVNVLALNLALDELK
jgi:K+-transporting ATPase ATPase C chain